jgi:GTP pyrophosphokinase
MKDIAGAFKFAALKHKGQKRKFTGMPYIFHPVRVYEIVEKYGGDPVQMAAAMLHDTIEDTGTTYEEILGLFGRETANMVMALTNDPVEKERLGKSEYIARKAASLGPRELLVKLADRLDNINDLDLKKSEWNVNYSRETALMLSRLDKTIFGDSHKTVILEINERILEYIDKLSA